MKGRNKKGDREMDEESMRKIIEATFVEMKNMKYDTGSYPKLIRPEYKDGTERFCEQELKQKFIDILRNNKICPEIDRNIYYAVEAPTSEVYYFGGNIPVCVSQMSTDEKDACHKDGQSGNFDLTIYKIYNNSKRIENHIEFKSGQPDPKEITKDIMKLANEPCGNVQNYFIHIIEKCDQSTYNSLKNKFSCVKVYTRDSQDCLNKLSQNINNLLRKSKNEINVYILVLNNGFMKSNDGGYYYFKYSGVDSDNDKPKIEPDSWEWHKYIREGVRYEDKVEYFEHCRNN